MNILLVAINAKYIHSNLAVYSLKAYAEEYQEHIGLLEYTINHRADYILQEIYKRQPDVLCFSCYIWNFRYVQELVMEFQKLMPEVPIWVGGPEVSYETERFLADYPMVKGAMVGEGEATFLELCRYYVDGAVLEQIRGIVFRDAQGGLVRTLPREPLSMDELPFCYGSLEDFENRIIYYETSRGCPFSCSYCLSSIEKGLRFRSRELVEKELRFFLEHKVPQVKFVDRTFNCNHEHALFIWSYLKEHDNGVTNFHFEISADLLTKEELALIATMRRGLIQLEIGVQSTHEPTIREIHRTMNLSRLAQVVARVRGMGNVHQHLDLIAGLPNEDFATFAESFRQVYAMRPHQLQLGFLKVLKGSYLYEHREEYGLVYREFPPYEVMCTHWLSYAEILKIKLVEEMLEVYYNSGQFEMTIKVLELLADNPFDLFLSLGEFYESRGLLAMSHSRIRRCEILLDYIEEKDPQHLALYRECLTFDLYYRERMKSRPIWAPPLSEYRELSGKYCGKGRNVHLEGFWYDMEEIRQQEFLKGYPVKGGEREYYLFSYEQRDPLSGQAKVERVYVPLESYVVVDLEMTGLNPKKDRILEIGAVKVEHGKASGTFHCMVNPHMRLSEDITSLTGITDEMVSEGCDCAEAIEDFLEFADGLVLVGHNLIFDYAFLKQGAVNQGISLEKQGIDTLKLARKFLPEAEKKSLGHLCGFLGIAREKEHRALDDAKATAQLLRILRERFFEKEPDAFCPRALQYKVKKQQPASERQKRRLKELVEYHKIELDLEIESLTRSEASRITNRILQMSRQVSVKHGKDGIAHQ